jgi:hypothetical protein
VLGRGLSETGFVFGFRFLRPSRIQDELSSRLVSRGFALTLKALGGELVLHN